MPDQGRWLDSRDVSLEVGDFIVYQLWEAYVVRWLPYLDVFHSGEIVDQWSTFQPGIQLAREFLNQMSVPKRVTRLQCTRSLHGCLRPS